jgi:hypothetical protein
MSSMQHARNAAIFNDSASFGLQWNAALDDAATVDDYQGIDLDVRVQRAADH